MARQVFFLYHISQRLTALFICTIFRRQDFTRKRQKELMSDKEISQTEPSKPVQINVETLRLRPLEVAVDARGIEQALRTLKRMVLREGILRELKRRRQYEKPGDRKRRKAREATRRRRRQQVRQVKQTDR